MLRLFLCILSLLLLSSCGGHRALKIEQRSSEAGGAFAFNARVAVKHEGERSSAGMRWVHGAGEDEILLLGPLGSVAARIRSNAQGVTLDAEGMHYAAQDVEVLTHRVLGWELPLSGLRYWVMAVPAEGRVAEVRRESNGQVGDLYQDGWRIHYSRYAGTAADSLPLRFVLQRDNLEIMVLIDEWEKQ